jgi:NTP pyrophosphatase (non-canonical NTP hydrolase)
VNSKEEKGSMAWREVERVVRLDLKHRRGHVPSTQTIGSVLDHMVDELRELVESLEGQLDSISPRKNPEITKEAADVLGLLFHVCQKCGISEQELNEACRSKLRLRFKQPKRVVARKKSCSLERVERPILPT